MKNNKGEKVTHCAERIRRIILISVRFLNGKLKFAISVFHKASEKENLCFSVPQIRTSVR